MSTSPKPSLITLATLAVFSHSIAQAAQPAPLVSPELRPDGAVTFRLRAPKAAEVKVAGQFGPETALSKDTQGVWSATVPAVPAGVHEYHFNVASTTPPP